MGQTIGVNIAKRAYDVEISQQFDGYSAVRIYVGTDDEGNAIVYEAGDTTGRTLEIKNDFGTQQMAEDILADIQGYQYQPLVAQSALLDPAAEMGDGITVNSVYSGLFVRATTFGRLMASDISAPTDQEIAHEYSVDTAATDRAFSRFVASTRSSISVNSTEIEEEVARATTAEENLSSRITINAESITSEVQRATDAESNLSSRITQNADSISATVTEVGKKLDHTRNNSSFGWSLNSTSFSINANNNQSIFYANKDGIRIRGNAEVTGKITATSGYIGGSSGFTITGTAIYNGKSSLTQNKSGVYIGTNGIALGSLASDNTHSKFQVDSAGNLYAQSGTFAGSVYAKNIKSGGSTYGYFNGSGITDGSINGGYKLKTGSVTGGVDYWGSPTGALGASTVDGGNIGYSTVTTDNTAYGINTSLGYADFSNNVFNGSQMATSVWTSLLRVGYNGTAFSPGVISFVDGNNITRTYSVLMEVSE